MVYYDVLEYWNNRDNPNNPSNKYDHTTYIYEKLKGCRSIMDFGPGVGRIFPAFVDCERVVGYDISFKYVEEIYKRSHLHPFDFSLTIETDVKKLKFRDNKFDAVVCVSVLLHQTPDMIEFIMSELCRVGQQVIAISYHNPDLKLTKSTHNFHHDYVDICERNGWTIHDMEIIGNQIYFIYSEAIK